MGLAENGGYLKMTLSMGKMDDEPSICALCVFFSKTHLKTYLEESDFAIC